MHTALRPFIASCKSQGILTLCPSAAALAIALGPTNPWLIDIAKETLVFRRAGFSPALWLLVPTFLLRNAPPWVTPSASLQMRILSYRLQTSLGTGFSKNPEKNLRHFCGGDLKQITELNRASKTFQSWRNLSALCCVGRHNERTIWWRAEAFAPIAVAI